MKLKIRLTQQRIREWVSEFGTDGVYVSFSGGKDSTVLLHIVRELYPDIPAVFCDTGLEYPEIRQFVKTWDNVVWLKPKKNFFEICQEYGFPLINKEVAEYAEDAKKWLEKNGVNRIEVMQMEELIGRAPQRLKQMLGLLKDKDGNRSLFNRERYAFMLDAPFYISNKCCDVMKKKPFADYHKETGRVPFTAQMASESRMRTQRWLQYGCNAFDAQKKISNPMSFWTEQDVLLYIYKNKIKIASVYGDVIKENDVDGQLDLDDLGLFDLGLPVLKTTGCDRTGCVLCGFAAHREREGEGRFEQLRSTHPNMYKALEKAENNGVTMLEAIKWVNENGNLNIGI